MNKKIQLTLISGLIIIALSIINTVNAQVAGLPQLQCGTMMEGGIIIIDLTCAGHTITVRTLLDDFGYLIMVQTATEIQMQPSTDTIEIMKEKGIDLNYTFTKPN